MAYSGQSKLRAHALGAIACSVGAATGAYAQDAQPASGESRSPAVLEEVTVTGTRIKQRADYVSPNPLQSIDAAEMQRLGIVNVADAVTQVPANVSQFQPTNTGGSAFFVGSTLANLRGLNPFFGTRTLTLVDTHRFIPTTQGDSVDLNFIPTNLIERTEIVTGGASAAYGSGAIAGVVNIFLNHKLEGVKLDVDYGASQRGDGDNWHAGLGAGRALFEGRGHVIFGAEYQKNDVIQSCSDARDWCRRALGTFSNDTGFNFAAGVPYTPKIPGQPWNVITDGLRSNQLSYGGVIFNNTPGSTSTFQFNDAGTDVVPFAVGAEGWRSLLGSVRGGDGEPIYKNIALYPDIDRKVAYGRMEYDFTDTMTGFAEASFGKVVGVNHQWTPAQNSAATCIAPDNAFLNAPGVSTAMRTAVQSRAGNSPFGVSNVLCGFPFPLPGFVFIPGGTVINKNWQLQDNQTVTTDTKVRRGVIGLSGAFADTWTWDGYYQYGKTTRDQIGQGYRTNWRYVFATDSIIDPRPTSPTFGQPVCRVNVTGFVPRDVDPSLANGCRPLNPFGMAASSEALAYAFGNLTEHDDITQNVVAGSVTGQLWEGWGAGPLATAVGLEYRVDKLDNLAGDLPFAQRTDFGLQYGDSFGGKTKITEGFLELEMPLLRDKPGARIASVNGAIREAHYVNKGGVGTTGEEGKQNITTWKLASVWEPLSWLRLRGSVSRDIRAASFRELYYSQSVPAGGLFGTVQNPWIRVDPANGVQNATDAAVVVLSGNPELGPETASTRTMGFVLTPLENMHFTADYYRIKITGGQALEISPNVVNDCFSGANPAKCAQIQFGTPLPTPGQDARSNITQVRAFYINSQPYLADGVDVTFDYLLPLSKLSSDAKGSLSFRVESTYALRTIIRNANVRDVAGQTGGDQGFFSDFAPVPNFLANLTISYLRSPVTLTTLTRFVTKGRLDKQNPKLDPNDPGFNPNLTYSITDATVPSYWVMDLNGSYDFKWSGMENLQFFANVSNVFDKDPPFSSPNTLVGVGGANAIFFDTLGRTYRVGMRMSF